MGEEPGAKEEAEEEEENQKEEKQPPAAEKLAVEGRIEGSAVVGGGGGSSQGDVDGGGGSRRMPPRGGGGEGKKAAVVDDDVGRGDVSGGGGGTEGGDAEGDEAGKREKAPGDATATGGVGGDFAVPGPAEISPPRASGSDEEQVMRPEPSAGGGGSFRASGNPSRVSSMAGSPTGGGGGEGARDSVRDAIRSQFLDEGRLASVEGTVMIEDVADDAPPPALEWDGLLQRQFEVEHMIRESLADEGSIQRVEASVLGLLRFQKQLTQVSQALGLTQTGLLFQQLISRLEGSEEQSLVTGLVDLDRIQDSAEPRETPNPNGKAKFRPLSASMAGCGSQFVFGCGKHKHTHTHTHTHTHKYIHTQTNKQIRTYIYTYIHIYIYTYVHINIDKQPHTHTHTQTRTSFWYYCRGTRHQFFVPSPDCRLSCIWRRPLAVVEQCRVMRSLVRIKVQDSADLAAATGTLSEARAFFHSLGVHAERKGVSRYDVLEELRKF